MLATRSIFVPSRLSYDAMAPMLHAHLGCDIKFGVMEMFVHWAVLIANEMHLDMASVFTPFFIALTQKTHFFNIRETLGDHSNPTSFWAVKCVGMLRVS